MKTYKLILLTYIVVAAAVLTLTGCGKSRSCFDGQGNRVSCFVEPLEDPLRGPEGPAGPQGSEGPPGAPIAGCRSVCDGRHYVLITCGSTQVSFHTSKCEER